MTALTDTPTRAIPADTFAVRLKLARHHAGDLTIRDAAERCGLNYGSWSNWERGGKPRDLLETVDAVADGLGVDFDWLLRGGALAAETRRRRDRHGKHETRKPTHKKMRTPINRIHSAARTDNPQSDNRRTARKSPHTYPIAQHAA